MGKYTIRFIGRKIGAIGVTYPIAFKCEAHDLAEAIRLLYEQYEHVRFTSGEANGVAISKEKLYGARPTD